MSIHHLLKLKTRSITFLSPVLAAGILCVGCKNYAQDKHQEEVSFFDSLSMKVCNCYTANKLKNFGLGDTCITKYIERDSATLKQLGIEESTVGGRLKIATEISVRLEKNCPYYIQQSEQFNIQIQKEISTVETKTFRGKITDESPYTNGEYIIYLAAGDSLKSFIMSDSIKKTQFDKLVNRRTAMLLVQYQSRGPENRILSIATNR
jgi:hypothetical protein